MNWKRNVLILTILSSCDFGDIAVYVKLLENSLKQGCWLQTAESDADPEQPFPPYLGAGLIHDLDLVPPTPQVTEHVPHVPQLFQPPGTGQKKEITGRITTYKLPTIEKILDEILQRFICLKWSACMLLLLKFDAICVNLIS